MVNLVKLGKALGSKTRMKVFYGLEKEVPPVSIADKIGISRAGLQKHLDSLLAVGLITKGGRGRATKYTPTDIARDLVDRMQDIANALDAHLRIREINDLKTAMFHSIGDSEHRNKIISGLEQEQRNHSDVIKKVLGE